MRQCTWCKHKTIHPDIPKPPLYSKPLDGCFPNQTQRIGQLMSTLELCIFVLGFFLIEWQIHSTFFLYMQKQIIIKDMKLYISNLVVKFEFWCWNATQISPDLNLTSNQYLISLHLNYNQKILCRCFTRLNLAPNSNLGKLCKYYNGLRSVEGLLYYISKELAQLRMQVCVEYH